MKKVEAARDERIDSARGALIVLVVIGHMLEIFIDQSPLYKAIGSSIYIFHMPLFVMIAGMFSKASLGEREYRGMLTRLVIPLVVFQFLYLAPMALKSGRLDAPALQPYWILWFLMAMVVWKLALPLFARLPFPVPVAAALSVAAGFNEDIGYALSLSRIIYFFPFFLAGYLYRDKILTLSVRFRGAFALLFVAIAGGVAYWSFNGLPYDSLFGSKSYSLAPVISAFPSAGRFAILILSFFSAVALLGIVNASRPLAYLGERSLTIYLLHGFVVIILTAVANKLSIPPAPALLPVWAGLAVLLSFALAPFDKWLSRLYEGIAGPLLRGRREAA